MSVVMKDWKKIADASGFEIPDDQLDRIAPILTALEEAFVPLRAGLPLATEPAPVFHPLEENRQ
jgi:hypothetical protein